MFMCTAIYYLIPSILVSFFFFLIKHNKNACYIPKSEHKKTKGVYSHIYQVYVYIYYRVWYIFYSPWDNLYKQASKFAQLQWSNQKIKKKVRGSYGAFPASMLYFWMTIKGLLSFDGKTDTETYTWKPCMVEFLSLQPTFPPKTFWLLRSFSCVQIFLVHMDTENRRQWGGSVCVCFLPIHSGDQVRWTYQTGSHRRKVTQDFSSTFFLRCVP